MRTLLTSLLVFLIASPPAYSASLSGGSMTGGSVGQTTEPDDFVSLRESLTFGIGGSIFDATTRIPLYENYIGPPPLNASYAHEEDFSASACNSTTRDAILALVSGDTATAADGTVIKLPNTCFIDANLTAGPSDTFWMAIRDARDDIKFYCDTATCGFRGTLTPADTDANNNATMIQLGTNRTTGVGSTCTLDGLSYTWGSRVVTAASGCSVDALALGPGDIVRISTNRITGYGAVVPNWMTRIEGSTDDSGDCTGLCTLISGVKKIQLQDVPPMSINPTAYFWGNEGLGSFFTKHPSDASGPSTYAETTGATLTLIERMGTGRCDIVADGFCGVGTGTNNIAENIWFEGVSFTVGDNVLGTRYVMGENIYGGGFYGGKVLRTVGRTAAMTFGGTSATAQASHVSIHSMDWEGTGFNGKCIGKILAIDATSTVTVDVQTDSAGDCDTGASGDDQWDEPEIMFSWDVADARLAGKRFLVTSSHIGGSPLRERLTLTGLNGPNPDGTSVPIDTTVAGHAINIDRFAGASYYMNDYSSYMQVINNSFENTRQHAIHQGCAGCAYAANYVTSDPAESVAGRGPFFHGNRAASGNIFDLNDQNHAMTLIDSGNGEPSGSDPNGAHGEGVNHAYCLNRKRTTPAATWPLGSATGTNYANDVAFSLLNTGQNGGANDGWSFLLNNAQTSLWQGTVDDCDNNAGDSPNDGLCVNAQQPNVPPAGQLFEPAGYRNRCATCNQDSNWETSTGSPNYGTPYTDVRSTEYGDATPVPGVPFVAERTGAPQSCFFIETPEFWCVESGFVGQMGANWDDWDNVASLKKLPAQIRKEGGTCTPTS